MNVIISEPDQSLKEKLISYLQEQKLEVIAVNDGKELLENISDKQFHAIIIDLDTKEINGMNLIREIKSQNPSQKIILTVDNIDRFTKNNVTINDFKKFGANTVITKPYEFSEISLAIQEDDEENTDSHSAEGMSEIEDFENKYSHEKNNFEKKDFSEIDIDEIYSGSNSILDLYIQMGDNRFLKILKEGDSFDRKRIEQYKNKKNISKLYFLIKDRQKYIQHTNNFLKKVVPNLKVASAVKVNMTKNVITKYLDEIYLKGIKEDLMEEGASICDNIFNLIKKDKGLYKVLQNLEDVCPTSYSHQFLVSFFTAAVGHQLSWNSKKTNDLAIMASLLHDVGKLKLPKEMQQKNIHQLHGTDKMEFKKHPRYGVEMVSKFNIVNESVTSIIQQHHEYYDGTGYPQGISGLQIFPLAKVVSTINLFTDFMTKNKKSPIESWKEITKNRDISTQFDPEVLLAIGRSFIKDND